jgi:hypothetical protein
LTIVDDFSRAIWIYLLIDKREVSRTLIDFFALVERQFDKKVKMIRSDNGTEFICLKNYFSKHGIEFQTSCSGTPQQNGRVERKHRHILNIARALRFQGDLPISFWGECVLTAGYLINRTPTPVLRGKTPYEMLYGQAPSYDHLKVFGCLCYAHNLGKTSDKFASRSRKCVFVGYPSGKKGWKLFDLDSQRYFVSRDVKFFETEFPYAHTSEEGATPSVEPVELSPLFVDDNSESSGQVGLSKTDTTNNVDISLNEMGGASESNNHLSDVLRSGSDEDESSNSNLNSHALESDDNVEELGRGHRIKVPSIRLRDHVTHTAQKLSPSLKPPSSQHISGAPYPLTHYVNCANFSLQHRRFIAAVTAEREPVHFSEAVKDVKWRLAMQQELQALEENGTWILQPLPAEKKPLGCKWVYKIKHNSDGTIERYKAWLVILGNHQVEGIDYNETFAPVVKMVTVRLVLAIAAAKQWEIHQMDVHNAFLHGDLHEDVYMKLPPGFHTSSPGLVCKLRKSLYGLKQAPRCWFAKLSAALLQFGFRQSCSDYSLFNLVTSDVQLVVLVYVDDLIVCGNNSAAILRFKTYLSNCFHMKDLGTLKYFLGVEVARNSSGIFLCQRKYALDIIQETGLLGAKPASTPLEQNHQLSLATGHPLDQPERYRRLIGRLIYLCFTRPELSYCVHTLSQFMQQPRVDHWMQQSVLLNTLKEAQDKAYFLARQLVFSCMDGAILIGQAAL